jgi:hypothetical protein
MGMGLGWIGLEMKRRGEGRRGEHELIFVLVCHVMVMLHVLISSYTILRLDEALMFGMSDVAFSSFLHSYGTISSSSSSILFI